VAGRRGGAKPPGDPLVAVDATIFRLEQMEDSAKVLRLTAPLAVAGLGDLSRRMKPTAIGFMVDLTADEWAAVAIEHQYRYAGGGYP
jgi:hypothetical protein